MKKRIGIIGLGKMGMPMALNIAKKGFQLTAYDVNMDLSTQTSTFGARYAKSPAEVGQYSDIVITMLPNADIVRSVVTGPSGLLTSMSKESVLIDMSTSDPLTTRDLAKQLESQGVHVLDAPVAKGIPAAESGTLTIMVGGNESIFLENLHILECMGTQIFYCGALGSGHIVKIINNLLVGVLVPICAESLALGVKAGVDADTLMKVITSGSGNSFVLDQLIRRHVLNNDYEGVFSVDYMLKDMNLAMDLAHSNHLPLLFGTLANQLYVAIRNKGNKDDCYLIVSKLIEELAGVEIRTKNLHPQ